MFAFIYFPWLRTMKPHFQPLWNAGIISLITVELRSMTNFVNVASCCPKKYSCCAFNILYAGFLLYSEAPFSAIGKRRYNGFDHGRTSLNGELCKCRQLLSQEILMLCIQHTVSRFPSVFSSNVVVRTPSNILMPTSLHANLPNYFALHVKGLMS